MTLSEKDRNEAREVLTRKWLTIDQVTIVKEAMEKTGMSFREAVLAKGILTPSQLQQLGRRPPPKETQKKTSSLYPILLLTTVSMIIGGGIYLYTWYDSREKTQRRETRDQRRKAILLGQKSANRTAGTLRREKIDRRMYFTGQARKALVEAKNLQKIDPKARVQAPMEVAIKNYTRALLIIEDTKLLEERAQAYEFWGAIPQAIADLEQAAIISPKKTDHYRDRISTLRQKLPGKIRKP